MSLKGSLRYLAGVDYLEKMLEREDLLRREGSPLTETFENIPPKLRLPTQCDIGTMVSIYGLRAKSMFAYPLVLASRWTGVAAMYKKYQERRASKEKK